MTLIKNKKTAEIVGLCFGDGSLTRRHSGKDKGKLRFQLRGSITEDKEHYQDYIIPLFYEAFGINVKPVICNGKDKSYGISTENKRICESLHELGVPIGIKGELSIPRWITSDKEFAKCFIRGLVDTDGSVFCGKDYNYPEKGHIKLRMSITSVSRKLVYEVSKILTDIAIKNLVIKQYHPRQQNCKDFSKLQIDGRNVVQYFEMIGSKNQKHISKFHVWKKFGFCPPYTKLEQRKNMLQASQRRYNHTHAGVAEPGQMRKFVFHQESEVLA